MTTRELLVLGHDVRQVPPVYAKPFRQSHKNDFRDAHAIAEAVQRPTTRCDSVSRDRFSSLEIVRGQAFDTAAFLEASPIQ